MIGRTTRLLIRLLGWRRGITIAARLGWIERVEIQGSGEEEKLCSRCGETPAHYPEDDPEFCPTCWWEPGNA
jgi:hypothetical protein